MDNIEKLLQQESAGDSTKTKKTISNNAVSTPPLTKQNAAKAFVPAPPPPKPAKKSPVDIPVAETISSPEIKQNGNLPKMLKTQNHVLGSRTDFEAVPEEPGFPIPPPTYSPPLVTKKLPDNPVHNEKSPTPPLTEEIERSLTITQALPDSTSPVQSESLTNTILTSEQSETSFEISEEQTIPEIPSAVSYNDIDATITDTPYPPKV